MAKSEKELQELKVKVEEVNKDLKELSEEDLEKVLGGAAFYTFNQGVKRLQATGDL